MATPAFEDIAETFEFLVDWEDRYRHVIELGRNLAPMDEALKTPATKVSGCASQVWIHSTVKQGPRGKQLELVGDSDALIVKGLIAILLALYSGQPARKIIETDALEVFKKLGLGEHLTPQRSNGFRSMVERMRADAEAALAAA